MWSSARLQLWRDKAVAVPGKAAGQHRGAALQQADREGLSVLDSAWHSVARQAMPREDGRRGPGAGAFCGLCLGWAWRDGTSDPAVALSEIVRRALAQIGIEMDFWSLRRRVAGDMPGGVLVLPSPESLPLRPQLVCHSLFDGRGDGISPRCGRRITERIEWVLKERTVRRPEGHVAGKGRWALVGHWLSQVFYLSARDCRPTPAA